MSADTTWTVKDIDAAAVSAAEAAARDAGLTVSEWVGRAVAEAYRRDNATNQGARSMPAAGPLFDRLPERTPRTPESLPEDTARLIANLDREDRLERDSSGDLSHLQPMIDELARFDTPKSAPAPAARRGRLSTWVRRGALAFLATLTVATVVWALFEAGGDDGSTRVPIRGSDAGSPAPGAGSADAANDGERATDAAATTAGETEAMAAMTPSTTPAVPDLSGTSQPRPATPPLPTETVAVLPEHKAPDLAKTLAESRGSGGAARSPALKPEAPAPAAAAGKDAVDVPPAPPATAALPESAPDGDADAELPDDGEPDATAADSASPSAVAEAPPTTTSEAPAPPRAPADSPPAGNVPAGIEPYLDAAEAGDPDAQHDLALIYVQGRGVAQDFESAAYWFRQAAQQGNANAQYNLGVMYEQGLGVPKDEIEALLLYMSAAEQGHVAAQYNAGLAYAEGKSIPRNFAEARKWFAAAADQGLPEAQYNLGIIYENGLGVPKDEITAFRFYGMASAAGHEAADAKLASLSERLTPAERQTAEQLVRESISTMAAPAAQGNAAEAAAASRGEVREIQSLLGALGYDAGPADGIVGKLTVSAIRDYQEAQGLAVDGRPTDRLLDHLRDQASR